MHGQQNIKIYESHIRFSDLSRRTELVNRADNLHLQVLQFQKLGRWLLNIPWRDSLGRYRSNYSLMKG